MCNQSLVQDLMLWKGTQGLMPTTTTTAMQTADDGTINLEDTLDLWYTSCDDEGNHLVSKSTDTSNLTDTAMFSFMSAQTTAGSTPLPSCNSGSRA